jgi:hypothetical protein
MYGIFEGPQQDVQTARDAFGSLLSNVYFHQGRSAVWKWVNQDLVIRSWHDQVGKNLDFDVLHYIEWDLALFAPLDEVFSGIPPQALGLTGLTPIDDIESKWSWTSRDPFRTDWLDLLEHAVNRYDFTGRPHACFGVGSCLPREFLDKYLSTPVLEISNNETRLPLYAQILGFDLRDNGLSRGIICDDSEYRLFNCRRRPDAVESEVQLDDILSQISDPYGRRAFHPYYTLLDIDEMIALSDSARSR